MMFFYLAVCLIDFITDTYCLYVPLTVFVCVCQCAFLCVDMSHVFPSPCPSGYLPVCLYVCLCVCLYVCVDTSLVFPSSYPSGCLLGCVSVTDCLSRDDYRDQASCCHYTFLVWSCFLSHIYTACMYNFISVLQLSCWNESNLFPMILLHTHNHFMALLDFVWDHPGEPAPER